MTEVRIWRWEVSLAERGGPPWNTSVLTREARESRHRREGEARVLPEPLRSRPCPAGPGLGLTRRRVLHAFLQTSGQQPVVRELLVVREVWKTGDCAPGGPRTTPCCFPPPGW